MIVFVAAAQTVNGEYTHTYKLRLTDKEIAIIVCYLLVLCPLGWVHWWDLNLQGRAPAVTTSFLRGITNEL